jgi:hypothetical protein
MNESAEPILTRDEIWKAHILKARSSRLSDANYCKKNELSLWGFTQYKKKLGFTKPRVIKTTADRRPFVEAITALAPELASPISPLKVVSRNQGSVPDAKWLAEFTRALLETMK